MVQTYRHHTPPAMQMTWPSFLARQLSGAVGHGTSELVVLVVAEAADEFAGGSVGVGSSCRAARLFRGAARTAGSSAAKMTEAFISTAEGGGTA